MIKKIYFNKIESEVWVKIFVKNNENETLFRNEIQALKNLSHPNIIPLIDYFQDSNSLYLVYTSFKGNSLDVYLTKKLKDFKDIKMQLFMK